jgi:hypothetical protein
VIVNSGSDTVFSSKALQVFILITIYLKVLSSEMDAAEISLIQEVVNREARKVLKRNPPSPHPRFWSIKAPPCFF